MVQRKIDCTSRGPPNVLQKFEHAQRGSDKVDLGLCKGGLADPIPSRDPLRSRNFKAWLRLGGCLGTVVTLGIARSLSALGSSF